MPRRRGLRYTFAVTHSSFAPIARFRLVLLFASAVVLMSYVPSAAQTGTATQFYMSYRAAFEKAQKIEDLLPFLVAKNRQEVEKTPAGERVKMFELMKMFGDMKAVKVIKTAKSGAGETLSVEGTVDGQKQTCAVEIVNEKGAWKLGAEKCGN